MKVILVHGIWDTGAIMEGLSKHLEAEGYQCFSPSLIPSNGSCGLSELASSLAEFIDDELPENPEFVLIGFSMGAIVGRYYLQKLGGFKRARAYFSICGPHSGTVLAYLSSGKGACEMKPGSSFLRELDASADQLSGIPKICYWSPFDLMIRPLKSARWSRASTV